MYTEGTASRPPTAKGLSDIGLQEDEICSRVVALRVLAAYPSLEQLAEIIFGA
jgi:hypothetical protein